MLNLSWNGFYLDGCKELASAMEKNTTLEDINLSSNRINKQCLQELWKGLKKNETLQKLRVSITPQVLRVWAYMIGMQVLRHLTYKIRISWPQERIE